MGATAPWNVVWPDELIRIRSVPPGARMAVFDKPEAPAFEPMMMLPFAVAG